jgi:hypothetical protein
LMLVSHQGRLKCGCVERDVVFHENQSSAACQ